MQPRIALSEQFLDCFADIPKTEQKRVKEFISKFRRDPFSSGINYEKINDAADGNFRSVRVGDNYRGIVLKPDTGNVYLLLWVAKHDDAYDWARRHRCDIHPDTGGLQLLDTSQRIAAPERPPEPKTKQKEKPRFEAFRDRELRRLGVPDQHLALVREVVTDEDLEALEDLLPREAFEALYMLAAGEELDDVMREYALPTTAVDTTDYAAALERDTSKRRFVVVEDDIDLQRILEAPLEKWRVFLHPSQRRLAKWDCNGPIRVLGGAGTGKTVVAMHRAKWLVSELYPRSNQKILFTTFNANLAKDIAQNLKKLCEPEQLARIEVINIDKWVSRFLKQNRYSHHVVYPHQKDFAALWKLALDEKPMDPDLPDSFYQEEWERVILPQRVLSKIDYFRARRIGRGVALSRRQRAAIWAVFEELHMQLQQKGYRPIQMAIQDAIELIAEGKSHLPYEAVVVDEAQDMGPDAMKLIRALVPERPNDLFIVGDGHQRIYSHRFALSHCGINIRGRSRKLRINYRTTEETRRFAVAVLEGQEVDDLDEGLDTSSGYRSIMHGRPPEIGKLAGKQEEMEWVQTQIQGLIERGAKEADICIVGRMHWIVKRYETFLQNSGFKTRKLSNNVSDDRSVPGIRLATMHRVKGLEFPYVFMVSINAGVCPLEKAVESSDDPTERRSSEFNERALFHVASSRAIRRLFVCCHGEPSTFIN